MRNNIIVAHAGEKTYIKTDAAFQYDYGLKLVIDGVTLPSEYEVQFGNTNSAANKTVTGDVNGVSIPDEYLRNGEDIHAYLYMHTDVDDGFSVYHIHIPVIGRAAIEEEEITPIEHHFVEEALETIAENVEKTEANVAHYPYIGENNHWMVWDADENEFADTGIQAIGVNGADGAAGRDGVDGKDRKDGRDGVDGKDGKDGQNGRDGIDGQNGQDGRDGVDGKDGKDGVDGKDGKDGKDADPIAVHNTIANTSPVTIYDGSDGGDVDDMVIVIDPVQAGSGAAGPRNIRRISGTEGVTITHQTDYGNETYIIAFDQAVYGATYNPITGKLIVDRVLVTKRCVDMDNSLVQPGWRNSGIKDIVGTGVSKIYYGQTLNVGTSFGVDTTGDNDLLYLGYEQYGMRQNEWINTEITVQICVPLANPVEYDLEPDEIEVALGENTFSVNNGRIASITYPCDVKLYIDHRIAELQALVLEN